MARIPRLLSPSVEHFLLRFLCEMRPGAQRAIFGEPPAIDGQRLHPEMQTMLRIAQWAGRETLTGGLPPQEARRYVQMDAEAGSGPPLPMAEVRDITYPGAESELPARLYVPHRAPPAPRPALLYFHGGGWVVGSLDTHDSLCRFLAARAGVAVISAGYRLAPEHPYPAAPEDAAAAYRWALESAAELGIDPKRIAVGGDSAGGNMATGLCQVTRDEGLQPPAFQLLIYPVTDARGEHRSRGLFASGFKLTTSDIVEFERCYIPDPSRITEPRASVLLAPDLTNLPPAYVATAGFDPLRDEGEDYARRLRDEGNRVALRRHPGLIHTFANMTSFSRAARTAMSEAAGALRMSLA